MKPGYIAAKEMYYNSEEIIEANKVMDDLFQSIHMEVEALYFDNLTQPAPERKDYHLDDLSLTLVHFWLAEGENLLKNQVSGFSTKEQEWIDIIKNRFFFNEAGIFKVFTTLANR